MRREEVHDIVVVEREARSPQPLSVSREVELPPDDPGFKLGGAIPAIAVSGDDRVQIGEKKDIHARIGWEFLFETQIACLLAKVTLLEKLQLLSLVRIVVRARLETVNTMHNQIEIVQQRAIRRKKI